MGDFNDGITVEDGDGPNIIDSKQTKGSIILEQFRRCAIECSKDMTKGGKRDQLVNGQWVKVDVPNQRSIFFNSVDALSIMLVADLIVPDKEDLLADFDTVDKLFEAEREKLNVEIKKIKKNFKTMDENYFRKYNQLIDSFELKQVELSKKKFMVLSRLMAKNDFGDEGSMTG